MNPGMRVLREIGARHGGGVPQPPTLCTRRHCTQRAMLDFDWSHAPQAVDAPAEALGSASDD
jgi:hypothetical protein